MPNLQSRVEPEIRAAFQKRAVSHGLSESELLRQLVIAELGKPEADPVSGHGGDIAIERITVRMPRFLMDAAKGRAKAKGMAPSRWISALVQSNLMRQPVMTDEQALMLEASNRELAALGRNLNQIAKALNTAFHETDRVKLELLTDLKAAIETNRNTINELVRASRGAWGID